MKQFFYVTVIATVSLLASCKKSTEEVKSESELIGKWTFVNWVSGSLNRNYDPGEYMQFNEGGEFFIRIDNEITQSYWTLLDDGNTLYIAPAGTLDMPDDGYEIRTLNSHSLVLYYTDDIDQTTIYLKK